MSRRVVLAMALLASIARAAHAHPIHTTLTVLTLDATSRTVTVSVRAFADDFSAAVARAAGKRPPRDSSAAPDDIDAYVRARLVIGAVPLVSCGVRRAGDVYLLCYRGALPAGAAMSVDDRLLHEVHADQVNIVQLQGSARGGTHLFTRGTGALDVLGR